MNRIRRSLGVLCPFLFLFLWCSGVFATPVNQRREVTTDVFTQTLDCTAPTHTYSQRVSRHSQPISGRERLGSEGNVSGNYTGTEVVTVTDYFVKGRSYKVRKTSTTATKNFTSLTFDPAVTQKLLSCMDYRLKKAWEELGFRIEVDGNYERSISFSSSNAALYVGPHALFEDILYAMGHFSSFVCGNLSSTSDWRTIWNAEKGALAGAYASRALISPQEMYCASFYNLCRKPSSLRRNTPRAYAYVYGAPAKISKARLALLKRALSRKRS